MLALAGRWYSVRRAHRSGGIEVSQARTATHRGSDMWMRYNVCALDRKRFVSSHLHYPAFDPPLTHQKRNQQQWKQEL